MQTPNIDILKNFGLDDMPDLDVAVLGALELFERVKLPAIDMRAACPLVVGSGNAEVAGRIIFGETNAIYASENDYERKLERIPGIDRVILVSASAGKHAPGIIEIAKRHGTRITLLTNNPASPAREKLDFENGDQEYVFPKNREPYTYNTSTYMGMILSKTKEDPRAIREFIEENIANMDFSPLVNFDKFFLIVPTEFPEIARMLHIKFTELFGRKIARDIETFEHMGHATTVVPAEELFISFGAENRTWGVPERRMPVPLPKDAGYGAMMAIGYYIVGQIQKRREPYFKEHIGAYVRHSSEIFGHGIDAIVE